MFMFLVFVTGDVLDLHSESEGEVTEEDDNEEEEEEPEEDEDEEREDEEDELPRPKWLVDLHKRATVGSRSSSVSKAKPAQEESVTGMS